MKKSVIKMICIILVVLLLVVIACVFYMILNQKLEDDEGESEKKATIVVISDAWSGCSEDYEAETVTEEFKVSSGSMVEAENVSYPDEPFKFKVVEIEDDYLIIRTKNPMSVSEVGESGIDLNTDQTEFEVGKGKKIELTTPSKDAGAIYIIEYK